MNNNLLFTMTTKVIFFNTNLDNFFTNKISNSTKLPINKLHCFWICSSSFGIANKNNIYYTWIQCIQSRGVLYTWNTSLLNSLNWSYIKDDKYKMWASQMSVLNYWTSWMTCVLLAIAYLHRTSLSLAHWLWSISTTHIIFLRFNPSNQSLSIHFYNHIHDVILSIPYIFLLLLLLLLFSKESE